MATATQLSSRELAELIESRIAAARSSFPPPSSDSYWRAQSGFASSLIAELVRDHKASFRPSGGTDFLRIAGISCSCTGGTLHLLEAWARKAKLAQA